MGDQHQAPTILPLRMRPGTHRTGVKQLAPIEMRTPDRPARTDRAIAANELYRGSHSRG